MVIIGGLGTVLGSFLGAAFVVLTPILLNIGLTSAMNPLFVSTWSGRDQKSP